MVRILMALSLIIFFIYLFDLLLKILFIYLTERERERACTHKQGELHREREKQTPGLSREPDMGLVPRTLGK